MLDFDGHLDLDEFIEWLQTVEHFFEYKDILPNKKVKLAIIKLKKNASLWWKNMKHLRQCEGKSKITICSKMKKGMQRKHLLLHHQQDMFLKLYNMQ